MAKLPRVTGKVFASNAAAEDIGQYGSALTGTKVTTSDIEQIQALSAYETGWRGAVISDRNYPTLQEMNGLQKTFSQQICYTLQEGIPEWDAGTTYYKGSIVKSYDNGTLNMYYSITDDNINNVITNEEYWQLVELGGGGEFANTDLSNLSDAGKVTASGFSMPSARYVDLTYISEAVLTAPANGWVTLIIEYASGSHTSTQLINITAGFLGFQSMYIAGESYIRFTIPVAKGDEFRGWNTPYGTVNSVTFRFIYAQGAESEA